MEPVLGGIPKRPVMPDTPMKAGTASPRVPGGLKLGGLVSESHSGDAFSNCGQRQNFVVERERGARCRPQWLSRELGARSKEGRCALQTTAFVINDKLTLSA